MKLYYPESLILGDFKEAKGATALKHWPEFTFVLV